MYLLEHSVVILLDDAYKDQAHSVSPFDEEAAAVLCLMSNPPQKEPPQKKHFVAASTCFQCQTMPDTTQIPDKRESKTKQTHPQTKLYHQYQTQNPQELCFLFSPAESNFTTTKEEPTTPKQLQQKRSENSREKSLETKRKYQLQN